MAIVSLPSMPAMAGNLPAIPGQPSSAAPFASLFQDAVKSVQGLEDQASKAVDGLLRGDGVDIHAAMIATQKADLAFEMALAVRGKAVAAYQTLMGMQF
jgi:flagellar hook-basal body complex protein FliE